MVDTFQLYTLIMGLRREGGSNRSGVADKSDRRYSIEEDTRPSPADIQLTNATACIESCYDDFLNRWSINQELRDVCEDLSQVDLEKKLWSLYCCDSIYCGVSIWTKGNDPNVDLIINKCKEIGYSLFDPGPHPDDYSCPSALVDFRLAGSQPLVSSSSSPATVPATTASPSPTADPSMGLEDNSTTSNTTMSPSVSGGLSEGSKAAIGICSSLAIIAIIFLVVFLLTRRQRHGSQDFFNGTRGTPRQNGSYSGPQSGSRTPLISPPPSIASKGPPLTPPARLSDRRLLPPILKSGTPHSSSAFALGDPLFPPTPLSTPTDAKNEHAHAPGHDRQAAATSIAKSPVSPPAAVHFASHFMRDSDSSYCSGPGGAPSTPTKPGSVRSGTASMTATSPQPQPQPVSPSRPPRPHDGPLEIPDLVTPAGPPPNRALPAPPPYAASPASPLFPAARPAERGHGREQERLDENAIGVALPAPPTASTRDFADLTQEYARESGNRNQHQHQSQNPESWGSWSGGGSGAGAGGSGALFGGRKRGHERARGDKDEKKGSGGSLQELDLEKLGGKY
ncbi:hypothetical protein F4779DRAFT_638496 [Xylariaceae sp. FL0662B]|nr:hypothetical protein F4779DRAFT_638496 [Xylariaceae sp. FL0662B]